MPIEYPDYQPNLEGSTDNSSNNSSNNSTNNSDLFSVAFVTDRIVEDQSIDFSYVPMLPSPFRIMRRQTIPIRPRVVTINLKKKEKEFVDR